MRGGRAIAPVARLTVSLVVAGVQGIALADFSYPDFSGPSTLNVAGSALVSDAALHLTPSTPLVSGAAWHNARQNIAEGFSTTFTFKITDMQGPSDPFDGKQGADGFAFVIQGLSPTLHSTDSYGLGGGLGYNQLGRVLAIEFDTWANARSTTPGALGDLNGNHISIHAPQAGITGSDERYSLGAITALPEMASGNAYTVTIDYLPGLLTVGFGGLNGPSITVPCDLPSALGLEDGTAYLGFTSATGGAWQSAQVLNWSMETVPTPGAVALLGIAGVTLTSRRVRRR